jgi:hypothetical protein
MESLSSTPKHAEPSTGEKCEQGERTDHQGASPRRTARIALWDRAHGRGGRRGRVVALAVESRVPDRGRMTPGHPPRDTRCLRGGGIRTASPGGLGRSGGLKTSIGWVSRPLERPRLASAGRSTPRRGRDVDRSGRRTVRSDDDHAVGGTKLSERRVHRRHHVRKLGCGRRRGRRLGLRHRRRSAGRGLRRRRGGRGSRCGRRRGRRGRGGSSPRREQRQRIDVALGVPDSDAEVDVRDVVLRIAGRPRLGDGSSFRDVLAALDEQRAEMGQ